MFVAALARPGLVALAPTVWPRYNTLRHFAMTPTPSEPSVPPSREYPPFPRAAVAVTVVARDELGAHRFLLVQRANEVSDGAGQARQMTQQTNLK